MYDIVLVVSCSMLWLVDGVVCVSILVNWVGFCVVGCVVFEVDGVVVVMGILVVFVEVDVIRLSVVVNRVFIVDMGNYLLMGVIFKRWILGCWILRLVVGFVYWLLGVLLVDWLLVVWCLVLVFCIIVW